MKILTTLLATVVSILFAGSSFSGESSALMKALTSPQTGMYAGDMEQLSDGAWVIFAQPRDGASTVRNVEALNTLDIDSVVGVTRFDPTGLPPIDFPFGWKPAWNRLMTALTSPQMGMYAGVLRRRVPGRYISLV